MDKRSARIAGELAFLGLKSGDRLSLVAEKSLEFLTIYLACLRSGVIFNPLNPTYTKNELNFFFSDAETNLVISDKASWGKVRKATVGLPYLKKLLSMDTIEALDYSIARETTVNVNAKDDVAALIYSSGTTGTPKGICISHHNLSSNGLALVDVWNFTKEDCLIHALPLYHVHGLFIILTPALLVGTKILMLERFDADKVINLLERATIMSGVPTYYKRLLEKQKFNKEISSGIKLYLSGSAPLSEKIFEQFQDTTGKRILERYGMTETGVISSNPLNGDRKAGSVGKPINGVDLKVMSPSGEELASGEIGSICVKGENVFKSYWRRDLEVFQKGWFTTGDLGYLDSDGYLFIVGRSKEMIISGGMNVYPKEIEREVDKLDGVNESAVFGVPHPDFGEAVMAVVVSKEGLDFESEAIKDKLKATLAGYKIPKRLFKVDVLPRNSMGKVQKNLLQDEYRSYFNS